MGSVIKLDLGGIGYKMSYSKMEYGKQLPTFLQSCMKHTPLKN